MTRSTIPATEFKAKCLALMDEVALTGKTIIITKRGRPIAELRPYAGARPRAKSPFGSRKGEIKILGDIISPIGTDLWEALK